MTAFWGPRGSVRSLRGRGARDPPALPGLLSQGFVSFPVVLFKFSPCSALVIKSFKHKAGSTGVFTHFPSPLSHTLITGLELLDNAESVTFYFLFFFFLAALLLGPIVHRFPAVLILDDLYIWLFSYSSSWSFFFFF